MRSPSTHADPQRGAWRRLLGATALMAALLAAGLLWRHSGDIGAYRRYFLDSRPVITVRFDALSGAMDEAGLQQYFSGLPLRCADVPRVPDANGRAGDRLCRADIDRVVDAVGDRVGGVPAMQLSAMFDGGRLIAVRIDLPWWVHHAALRWLVAQLGAPASIDLRQVEGSTVAWRARAGVVELNRDPGWDPLKTSGLQWSADASASTSTPFTSLTSPS